MPSFVYFVIGLALAIPIAALAPFASDRVQQYRGEHSSKQAQKRTKHLVSQKASIKGFMADPGAFTQYLLSRILFITLVTSLIGLAPAIAAASAQGLDAFAGTVNFNGGRAFIDTQQWLFTGAALVDIVSTIVVIRIAGRAIGTYRRVHDYENYSQAVDEEISRLRDIPSATKAVIAINGSEKNKIIATPAKRVDDSQSGEAAATTEGFEDLRLSNPEGFLHTAIPVTIYLSDASIHEKVETAVELLLTSAGLEIDSSDEPQTGSWFRSIKAKMTDVADSREAAAVEAQITSTMMENLSGVLMALKPTKDAVVRVGSLLIIKVDGAVTVTQLTAMQQFYLDRNPALAKAPNFILQALSLNGARISPEPTAGANSSEPRPSPVNNETQTDVI